MSKAELSSSTPMHALSMLCQNSPAANYFAAAWAAYEPYRDPHTSNGRGDEGCAAWCKAQLEATARLAAAPARTLPELEAKLAAAMVWFEENGAGICQEEGDLLRSCLRDLRAMGGAA